MHCPLSSMTLHNAPNVNVYRNRTIFFTVYKREPFKRKYDREGDTAIINCSMHLILLLEGKPVKSENRQHALVFQIVQ